MKTFEQCCDEVAKKYGFSDYLHWRVNGNENHSAFHTESAELFARDKVVEAIQLQREYVTIGGQFVEFEYTEQEILEKLFVE